MTIEVTCDCSMTYRLPDRFAGKTARCRECRESIPVPVQTAEKVKKAGKAEKAVARKAEKAKAAPARSRGARPVSERFTSESIHQMSPLNLSESRAADAPSARARAKAAQAKTVGLMAKKKDKVGKPLKKVRRGGPETLDSEEELPTKKKGKKARRRDDDSRDDESRDERPAKKKKLKKGKKDRRRDDESRGDGDQDAADQDDRPAKKKKGKKASAEKPALRKGRKSDDEDVEDEDAAEAAEPKKNLTRAEKRRKQMIMLGGSLGLAAFCCGMLFLVIALGNRREENAKKSLEDSIAKMAAAQKVAKAQDWDAAQKAYKDTIDYVESHSSQIEDQGFFASYKLFKAENDQFLGKIVAARAKLASDPQGAAADFESFTGAQDDEVVYLAGVEGLVAANDGSKVDLLATCAKTARFQSVKDAAIKGLIQAGSPQATPFLAQIIRTQAASPLGHTAAERALEGMNPDPEALAAVADAAALDAGLRGKALQKLGAFRDKKYEPLFERLKNDPAVGKDATEGLADLRGEKP